MAERVKIAHLLRRATFGPTAEEVDAAEQSGYEETVARLVGPPGPSLGPKMPVLPPDPTYALHYTATQAQKDASYRARRIQQETITDWWIDRMVASGHEMEEKLTFFWHGHWATSLEKVASAPLMLLQQSAFRRHGRGDFGVMVKALLRDPALIMWLDGGTNTRVAPNENLARELMELFTLGIGNYTEDDVKEGARALTGWNYDRVYGSSSLIPSRFDPGEKTILGTRAPFDADGLADFLVRQPASARFIAKRLWFRFASDDPIPADALQRMTAAYVPGRDIAAVLAAMFNDPAFQPTNGKLVKQPLEWVVGAMRQLRVRPSNFNHDERRQLVSDLDGLGQVPFKPPSVGGWPSGLTWLNSYSAQVRLRIADRLVSKVSHATLSKLTDVPVRGRSQALARLLVVDSWTDRTLGAIDQLGNDVRGMLAMGLVAPEYCVH